MAKELTEYKTFLKNNLSKKRYTHSLNVAAMSRELAELYGEEKEKAYFMNLLALEITNQKNYATASALIILFRKFFIPMAQRKQALEKMIIALGGEKDGHSSENA